MAIFAQIGMLFLAGLLAVWRGFVFSILWGWFVIPTFPGAPALLLWPAVGLSLLVAFLTHEMETKITNIDYKDTVIKAIAHPAAALFFGWIYHLFM